MSTLVLVNAFLTGLFAFAALHYVIQWWLSRREWLLLVFAAHCALFSALSLVTMARLRATTIPDFQAALDLGASLGMATHGVVLHLYAQLGERRDRLVRALITALIAGLIAYNLFSPLRGTVLELRPLQLPGGGTGMLPIRTPPGVLLGIVYIAVVLVQLYGCFVAATIWPGDRARAILVGVAVLCLMFGATIAALIDFAGLQAPYVGSPPLVVFVVCMAVLLSREYSARAERLRLHQEQLEGLVSTRTRQLSEAKDEADRANAAKSQFLAHMSHEIRTPLTAILMYSQLLLREVLEGPQRRKLQTIDSSSRHLLSIVNNVLEMSKIEAGRLELVDGPFDLRATLDELDAMFGGQTRPKGVELTLELDASAPTQLLGDGAKVKQVLVNLVGNAAKFTPKGSIRVKASASARDDGSVAVAVTVADTGVGIAAKELDRMFEPFEQLGAGVRAGGTGLGLTISRAFARLMSGDLTVTSPPGVGSTFTFTFAAKRQASAQAPEAARPQPAVALAPAERRRVLIVDDLLLNRDLLTELLAQPGLTTRTASGGLDALTIHADWRPDLVLMDLRMPEMDGLEAIRRLRAEGSRAAIGVLSASGLKEDEEQALALGADFFLRRPYTVEELLGSISRVFSSRPA